MEIDNSLLKTNRFTVTVGDNNDGDTDVMNWNIVGANLPDIASNESPAGYRNENGFVPGDTLEYSPFSLRFMCDEKMNGYKEIFNWMLHNSQDSDTRLEDITLSVFSSKNILLNRFRFEAAFPTSISGADFNVQGEGEPAAFNVSFRYDTMIINDI